jgi:DNA-binding LacI/PurR family transcriptional regulator
MAAAACLGSPATPARTAGGSSSIIARIENQETADIVRALKLPTIDLRGGAEAPGVIGMYTDDRAVIEMAGEHLVSNGLKHLAYCGYPGPTPASASSWPSAATAAWISTCSTRR